MPGAISKTRMFGRDLRITIDQNGHRMTPSNPAQAAQKIHVIGDSQVFGWGLSDDETISARLQSLLGPGYQVVNRGVPGLGPPAYEEIARSIPESNWVVIVNTEENDFFDSYGLFHEISAHCGYLNPPTPLNFNLPCPVLNSRAIQRVGQAFSDRKYRIRPTPLEYNPLASVASEILSHRIKKLYQPLRESRQERFLSVVIPWVCRYVNEQCKYYYPPVSAVNRTVAFDDDCNVEGNFNQDPNKTDLYIPGDTHLSVRGAKVVAETLANTIVQRNSKVDH